MTRISNSRDFLVTKRSLTAVLAGTLMLGACSEPEVILAGKRENVRAVLQNPGIDLPPEDSSAPPNSSRPLALPAARNNASWTHSIGTQKYRVAHPALRGAPRLAWSAPIGDGDGRRSRITADPVVSGGRIFTLDSGALVTATSTSGATLWTRDLTPASDQQGQSSGGGLAVDGNTVYVSVGYGVLAALDVNTGAVRWEQKLESTGSGTPTVWGDMIYLTSGDDTGWAIRKSDGRVQWQSGTSGSLNNVLGAPAPALNGKYALFAYGSGEVQAVFAKGGLERWMTSVVGRRPGRARSFLSDVTSAPVISGGTVYVGNFSGRLAALDIESGIIKWSAKEGAIGPVWPAGDSLFMITDLNELVRLDARDGSRIWGVPLSNFTTDKPKRQAAVFAHNGPIIAGGRVIIASNDGKLRSYDPRNGALLTTADIPGGATTAPVVAGGTLYVVSAKGQLHAFR